jgi:hypothetical protein
MIKKQFTIYLLLILSISLFSQEKATIKGRIIDVSGKNVELVNISIIGEYIGTMTDFDGNFKIQVPANKDLVIVFSHIEYKSDTITLKLKLNETKVYNKKMETNYEMIGVVNIEERSKRYKGITRLETKNFEFMPSMSGGIENMIKSLPGTSSNNEMSSQYTVRGGNFDENLIYVNDIEVYKPQLIKSGEQEGLSFINPDLVQSVEFSSGGYESRYGDKMSSVLDIKYKKPKKFGGSVSGGLLGGTAHLEGGSKDHRLTFIVGARYKTNKYLLNTLDTKGDYNPRFWDIQSYITLDVTDKWEMSILTNYADNAYNFIPQNRETSFGTVNAALGLKIYFEGQEADRFKTFTGAYTNTFKPNSNLSLKFIATGMRTIERESYDILGQYYLNELDKDLGSDNVGDSLMNIGVGSFLTHARNRFYADVFTLEHKANYKLNDHRISWGVQYKLESIEDYLNEWELRDSAGYSIPFPDTAGYNPNFVSIYNNINSSNTLTTNKYSGYIQDSYTFGNDSVEFNATAGLRFYYSDINNEFLISPRASFAVLPEWEKDIVFRFATGMYYQPPFYKEYRDINGNLNLNVKSQQSIHFVLGSDYNLKIWTRPFKLITEVYYKILNNVNPYIVDNVKIRYLANNSAHGYAAGRDMKLTGEFVPGAESWVSLSVMKTEEDIEGDNYGYIPRPSDQLVNANIFFQDYVPKFPSFKAHLNLVFGSGLPFGPPYSERGEQTLRMPAYKRVDLGFSKIFKTNSKEIDKHNVFANFKYISLTAEIFNLLGINNTISYVWVKDIYGRQYAVPNYLTSRRFNVKLTLKF